MNLAEKLSILVINQSMWCPKNPRYGARVMRFVSSKIFLFGGKSWQIRSIRDKTGKWYIFPFLIDSGGCCWNTPIISDPVLKFLNLDRDKERDSQHPDTNLLVPLPLQHSPNPFAQDWGIRGQIITPDNLIFNMIGSESACILELIEHSFRMKPDATYQEVHSALLEDIRLRNLLNPNIISENLKLHMEHAKERKLHPQPWMDTWDQHNLPIDPAAFVHVRDPLQSRCCIS
jgi:hypothetical protein